MQLPGFLAGIPKIALVLALPVVAFMAMVAVSIGTSNDGDEAPAIPTVAAAVTNRQALPTSAPQNQVAASPTRLADRTNCDFIRGTDYRSTTEQAWFQENCTGATATPNTSTAQAAATRSPSTTSGAASTSSSAASQPAAPAAPAASGVETPTGHRLVIPAAGINTDIYITAMSGGQMPDPKGYFNALTYDWSGYSGLGSVGTDGNLVLSGHVDCGRCNNGGAGTAVFWHARDLSPGDTAQVYTADGRLVNYVVTAAASYTANMDYTSFVATSAADMTIITCTGTFSGGEYDNRHVVQFVKV